MNMYMSAALAAIAVLAVTFPTLAAAPKTTMTSCPIQIRSLDVSPSVTDPDRGRHPGTDFITFRNTRTVAASHVTFAFYAQKSYVKSATSKGLFSPAIDVAKQFPDTGNILITSVLVSKADFADGTVCRNRNKSGAVISRRKHAGPKA